MEITDSELLQAIWNATDHGLAVIDSSGNVKKLNLQYAAITGRTEQELLNKDFSLIFPESKQEAERQYYARQYQSDKLPDKKHYEISTKDYSLKRIELQYKYIFDEDHKKAVLLIIKEVGSKPAKTKPGNENIILSNAFTNKKVAWWDYNYENEEVRFSPNKATMIGYSPQEFPTNVYSIAKLIHPDDYEHTMEVMSEHLKGNTDFYEVNYRIKTKSGPYAHFYDYGQIIERTPDGKPKRLFGIVVNIEHEIRAKKALQKFSTAVQQSPVSVAIIDPKGTFEFINQAFTKLTNFSHQEVIGKNLYQLGQTDGQKQSFFNKLAQIIKSGEVYKDEIYGTCKNGMPFWGLTNVSPLRNKQNQTTHFLIIIEDISDRKKNEKALKNSHEQYTQLAKQSHSFNWIINQKGLITFVNETAEHVLGYTPEEICDRMHFHDFYHKKNSAGHQDAFDIFEHKEPFTGLEKIIKNKNGQDLHVSINGIPILNDQNKLLGYQGSITDISTIKRTESELKESEKNYRSFIDTMHDMVIISTFDNRILFANAAAKNRLGYSLDELNQMGIIGIHPPELRDETKTIMKKVITGEKNFCPLPLISKEGLSIPVETYATIGKWSGENCIFGISKDLSREKELSQRFEQLFRINPTPIALSSYPERKFLEVNDAFLKSLGYAQHEIIGKSSEEIGLFADAEEQKEVGKLLAETGSIKNYKLKVKGADGTFKSGLFFGHIIGNETQKYFLTVMVDITEHEKLDEKLREQNQLRELLLEIASEFINLPLAQVDKKMHHALKKMGQFVHADRAYTFDYLWDKDICKNIHEWCEAGIAPEFDNLQNVPLSLIKNWVEQHRIGKPMYVPDVFGLKDKNLKEILELQGIKSLLAVPMMNGEHCIGFVGFDSVKQHHKYSEVELQILKLFAQVLTNLKLREENTNKLMQAMYQTEDNQRKLKESQTIAKLGGWELNLSEGIFTFTDNFYALYHTNAQQMGGYKMTADEYASRFLFPEDANLVKDELTKAMKATNEKASFYLEHKFRYHDGGTGYLGVKYFIIKDKSGNTIKTYGVNQDITEKKKIESELIAAKEKAEESDRLKSAFINNISHEIRTPLNGILGFGEFLLNEEISSDEKNEYHQILKRSSDRLLQTITDIMDISMVMAGTLEANIKDVDIIPIIQETTEHLKISLSNKEIKIRTEFPAHYEALSIATDEELFTKVLKQLLDNALKFTTRGSITSGFYISAEDWVTFYVKDTGKGIDDKKLELIFEPFMQEDSSATREFEGSGLGLTIARNISEFLGGKLWVESKAGKGSDFYFRLPLKKRGL